MPTRLTAKSPPTFYPAGSPQGPWGVDTIGSDWCVIHKVTLQARRVGPIGMRGGRVNHFDRANDMARQRNRELAKRPPVSASSPPLFTHEITVSVHVRARSDDDARALAAAAGQHLLDTFNDDCSLDPGTTKVSTRQLPRMEA